MLENINKALTLLFESTGPITATHGLPLAALSTLNLHLPIEGGDQRTDLLNLEEPCPMQDTQLMMIRKQVLRANLPNT